MYRLVLFDVANTLIADSKDVSEYVSESIRNIYGRIVTVNIREYQGMSSQDMVEDILRKDQMEEAEIQAKLKRIMEDLFYCYYNVAGHDRQVLIDGSRELLGELWKKDITTGIVTGEAERITRLRLEKTGTVGFFKFGAFGADGKRPVDIMESAVAKAKAEAGVDRNAILVVASSPYMIKAAKASKLAAIGIANAAYSADELKNAGADLVVKSPKDKGKIVGFLK